MALQRSSRFFFWEYMLTFISMVTYASSNKYCLCIYPFLFALLSVLWDALLAGRFSLTPSDLEHQRRAVEVCGPHLYHMLRRCVHWALARASVTFPHGMWCCLLGQRNQSLEASSKHMSSPLVDNYSGEVIRTQEYYGFCLVGEN